MAAANRGFRSADVPALVPELRDLPGGIARREELPALASSPAHLAQGAPQAPFSRLCDVRNGVIVAADIEPQGVGARVLAGEYRAATGRKICTNSCEPCPQD